MKVYRTKKIADAEAKKNSHGFTFPIAGATLDDQIIEDSRMRAALTRFAKEILRQRPDSKDIVGVKIHNVGITFILKG